MKIIWEDSDIRSGLRVQKPDCGISGSYIVGYRYLRNNCPVYGLVSMADGMFVDCSSGENLTGAQAVAILLNNRKLLPAEQCPGQWMKERS